MRISKVRTYLSNQIALIDSKMKQWDDAFGVDNIPNTLFSKVYHIDYGISSATKGQTTEILTIGATVTFLFKGERKTIETFDDAMEKVNNIALTIMSQESLALFRDTDNFPIQSVARTSQVPQALNTNDNSILIPLELEMTIIQSIC